MEKPHDSNATIKIGTKFGIFRGTEGDQHVKSLEEENEEMDWRYHV